jgi:hypothetical protein
MTRADMAETVENAEVGEDAAANHDIFDQSGIDARNPGRRRLGARLLETEQERQHQQHS